jgi:hypothetical protein
MSLFGDNQDISTTTESPVDSDASPILFGEEANRVEAEESVHGLGVNPLLQTDFDQDTSEDNSSESASQNVQPSLSQTERNKRSQWQAQEIRLAQSIDAATISDLNSNLLGVSTERKRGQSQIIPSNVRPWQSRYRWTKNGKNRVNLPPAEWISWPLEPHQAPGNDDWYDSIKGGPLFGSFLTKPKSSRPSADLEEILCDLALEKHRKRWEIESTASKKRARLYDTAIASQQPDLVVKPHPTSAVAVQQDQIGSPSMSDIHPKQPQPIRKDSDLHLNLESPTTPTTALDQSTSEPHFSADDERSHQILQPSVRNILSKIDALLLGMSNSRLFHDKANSHVPNVAESNNQNIGVTHNEDFVLAISGSSSDEDSVSTHADRRNKRKSMHDKSPNRPKSVRQLGPRDWSDVLGIASLTGWNSDVVERATMRCTQLFGEGMSFTTFSENQGDKPIPEPVHYHPNYRSSLGVEVPWVLETLQCPHADCSRSHSVIFSERYRLVEHIRKVHKWDPITEQMPKTMVGSVHLDGFMQPIHARQGWRGKDQKRSEVRGVKRKKGIDVSIPAHE